MQVPKTFYQSHILRATRAQHFVYGGASNMVLINHTEIYVALGALR